MSKVGIIMGSKSDYPVMKEAEDIIKEFDIDYEIEIVSAHRTPDKMNSPLPVIGVPIKSRNSIDGWDSILSILQMPGGVPVATVALDGAKNAGILAIEIIGASDSKILKKIVDYKKQLKIKVNNSNLGT